MTSDAHAGFVRTAVDTNVLSALLTGTVADQALARSALLKASREGPLFISPVVHAELQALPSTGQGHAADVEAFLESVRIEVAWLISEPVWRDAGQAFGEYALRRRHSDGGSAKRLLADFLIGAQAASEGGRLLTFDKRQYSSAFPSLLLLP